MGRLLKCFILLSCAFSSILLIFTAAEVMLFGIVRCMRLCLSLQVLLTDVFVVTLYKWHVVYNL